jgi:AcrR family transcriptional regulator
VSKHYFVSSHNNIRIKRQHLRLTFAYIYLHCKYTQDLSKELKKKGITLTKNNKEITKISIQQAALELFSKRGYTNVSMDEIAANSNLTKRTIYKHFPSKLALFASLFEGYLQQLNDEIAQIIAEDNDIATTIKDIFRHLFNFTYAHQSFMKLFWMINTDELTGEIPPEVVQHIRLWNKSILDQCVEAYEDRKLTGLFSRYSPELIVHMLSAINKGIFVHFSKERKLNIGSLERDKEELLELFLALIDLGLGVETKKV